MNARNICSRCNGRRNAVRVGEGSTLFFRRFQPARHAQAEQAVFIVVEDDMVERFQRDVRSMLRVAPCARTHNA
jgi:hypothetical protein